MGRLGRLLLLTAFPLLAATAPPPALLRTRCAACHSEQTKSSGFSVSTSESILTGGSKHGPAVIPGHPEQSPLVKLLKGELQPKMPMGKELAPAEIAAVETWIRSLPPQAAP